MSLLSINAVVLKRIAMMITSKYNVGFHFYKKYHLVVKIYYKIKKYF